jgi:hypothetical protein
MSIELLRESTLALKAKLDKLPDKMKNHITTSTCQHVTDMMELLDEIDRLIKIIDDDNWGR